MQHAFKVDHKGAEATAESSIWKRVRVGFGVKSWSSLVERRRKRTEETQLLLCRMRRKSLVFVLKVIKDNLGASSLLQQDEAEEKNISEKTPIKNTKPTHGKSQDFSFSLLFIVWKTYFLFH